MSPRVALLALVGCAVHTVPARPVDRPQPSYVHTHDAWTRQLRLYRQLQTRLVLRATWLGPEERRAGAQELAWRADLSPEEYQALDQAAVRDAAASHELAIASMRIDPADRDLGGDPDSPWRLRLDIDGTPCPLLSITRVDQPTAVQRLLYPQLNAWADLWLARFDPACGSTGTATLTVSGAYGAGQVQWELPPAG